MGRPSNRAAGRAVRAQWAALAVPLCFAHAASAQVIPQNGTIGIYSDASASSCCLTASPTTATIAHVIFTLAGASAAGGAQYPAGITSVEFRIEASNPSAYVFVWNANAAFSTVLGNPLDETPGVDDARGIIMSSSGCLPSDHVGTTGDRIELGTIQILNLGAGGPCDLLVKRKSPPTNLLADCPCITLCDPPVFGRVCLSLQPSQLPDGALEPVHFIAHLNASACDCPGDLGVDMRTWTRVKALFR